MRSRSRRPAAIAALALPLLVATAAPAAAGAPTATNDDFGSAKIVTQGSLPYVDEVDASGATTQDPTEPESDCGGAGETIWYRITPTTTRWLRADAIQSWDTAVVSVWRGTTLAGLTEVDCNDGANEDQGDGRVAWKAVAGTRYYIKVDGGGEFAVLHLRQVAPPSNDDFANARTVSSLPFTHVTDLINATRQAGEPDPGDLGPSGINCTSRGRTIWYRIKTNDNRTIEVDTFLSGFDTWVAVHRGTSLGGLTYVQCNDDTSSKGNGLQSNVTWRAEGGKTYYIQVGGYGGQADDLAVRFRLVTPPSNDQFANAVTLPQSGSLREAETRRATLQAGEPISSCLDHQGASVWYRFTAASSTVMEIDTRGSDFDTMFTVYTGGSLGSLTEEFCSDDDVDDFAVTSGTVYRVQVTGTRADQGHLHIHLEEAP